MVVKTMAKQLTTKIKALFFSLLSLILILLTLLGWHTLKVTQNKEIQQTIQSDAKSFEQLLKKQLSTNLQALERMAGRWTHRGGTPENEWRYDAKQFLQHHPNLQTIFWIAPHFTTHWSESQRKVKAHPPLLTTNNKTLNQLLSQHYSTSSLQPLLLALQKEILTLVPLVLEQKPAGFLLSSNPIEKLISSTTSKPPLANYNISIKQGNTILYNKQLKNKPYRAPFASKIFLTTEP